MKEKYSPFRYVRLGILCFFPARPVSPGDGTGAISVVSRTFKNRPLHVVCGYADDENLSIIITAYQPHSERWIDFTRRKK